MSNLVSNLELDGFMEYLLGLANEYVNHFDSVDDAYSYYIHHIAPTEDKTEYKLIL